MSRILETREDRQYQRQKEIEQAAPACPACNSQRATAEFIVTPHWRGWQVICDNCNETVIEFDGD